MQNFGYLGDIEPNLVKNGKIPSKIHTYDEAIEHIGTGKFHAFQFFISGLSVMTVVIETLCIGLLMPIAKCDLGFSLSEQGVLASAGFLGVVLSSYMWGFLADTWGRKRAVHLSVTLASIFTAISAFSVNIWMLAVFRFLTGFAISGCQASTYTYIGEFHGPKTRPKYIAYVSTFLPLGIVYLPAMALVILPLDINWNLFGMNFTSWRLFMLVGSIPTFVSTFSFPVLPESPKYLFIQGKHEEAMEVLRKCFKWNESKPAEDYPVKNVVVAQTGGSLANVKGIEEAIRLIWNQTKPIFNKCRLCVSLNLNFIQFIIFFVAHGVFMWIPMIMSGMATSMYSNMTVCESIETMNFNPTISDLPPGALCSSAVDQLAFQIIIYMGIGYTVCYAFIGFFIHRVGKKRLLILWLIACGIAMLGVYWAKGLYLNAVLLFIALAVGNAGGIIGSISIDYYPTNINAMAFCFIMMCARFGAVAGSNIVGVILGYDCNFLFLFLAALILISALCACLLPSKNDEQKCIDVIT